MKAVFLAAAGLAVETAELAGAKAEAGTRAGTAGCGRDVRGCSGGGMLEDSAR